MPLAQKLKDLRLQRGWTQQELADRSGLGRRSISYWEKKDRKRPSADILLKFAKAFNINLEELYQAAGYIKGIITIHPRPETAEEILDRLKLATPITIPIYTDFPFHAGDAVEPIDYIYRARHKAIGEDVEGYVVYGNCLEPQIFSGDIIIINKRGDINSNDIVACLVNNQLCIARLKKIDDELWLENNVTKIKFQDCQIAAPVIEIRRRLK